MALDSRFHWTAMIRSSRVYRVYEINYINNNNAIASGYDTMLGIQRWPLATHMRMDFFFCRERALTSPLYTRILSTWCGRVVCEWTRYIHKFCFRQIIMWINSNNHRDVNCRHRWTHVKRMIIMALPNRWTHRTLRSCSYRWCGMRMSRLMRKKRKESAFSERGRFVVRRVTKKHCHCWPFS